MWRRVGLRIEYTVVQMPTPEMERWHSGKMRQSRTTLILAPGLFRNVLAARHEGTRIAVQPKDMQRQKHGLEIFNFVFFSKKNHVEENFNPMEKDLVVACGLYIYYL